jgi:hypothetical protein
VEGVKASYCLATVVLATSAFACEALLPKNPLKAAAVCGRADGPDGKPLPDVVLQLIREDQTVISETRTDAAGGFQFAAVDKGKYYLTINTKGWAPLGWPVTVTRSKASKSCSDPLIVEPQLVCGGSVGKKGYHPTF